MKPTPGKRFNFILPIYVTIPHVRVKDEKQSLSYNNYSGLNYMKQNIIKQSFKPIYSEKWEGQADKIRIHYHVQRMTKASFDTMNYVSIVDKIFCDWLQVNQLLKDDDFSRVELGRAWGINQCKKNRCYATVEILENFPLHIDP